jgi:hypothetical protein
LFAQQKRLEGLTFTEIAQLWKKQKHEENPNIYMAFGCQEKTSPIDRKESKNNK